MAYDGSSGVFVFQPAATIDYYRLQQKGYSETGGGKAFDLIVASRTSNELAATASLAAGLQFVSPGRNTGWLRMEVEEGHRAIISGGLSSTTAKFADAENFTLTPEKRTGGWVGKLRASGGNGHFKLGGELNAEQQQNRVALSLRASLQIGL